jgi:hypothetical protein
MANNRYLTRWSPGESPARELDVTLATGFAEFEMKIPNGLYLLASVVKSPYLLLVSGTQPGTEC